MADVMSEMLQATHWEEGALEHFMELIQMLSTPNATIDVDIKGAVSSMAVAKAFAQMNIPERLDANSTPRFVDDTRNGINIDVSEYVYQIGTDGTMALDIRFVPSDNLDMNKANQENINRNIIRPYFAGQRFTLKALDSGSSIGTEWSTTLFQFFPHHVSLDKVYSYTMLWRDGMLIKETGKYKLYLGDLRRAAIASVEGDYDTTSSLDVNKIRVDTAPSEREYDRGKLEALEIYKMPFNMV